MRPMTPPMNPMMMNNGGNNMNPMAPIPMNNLTPPPMIMNNNPGMGFGMNGNGFGDASFDAGNGMPPLVPPPLVPPPPPYDINPGSSFNNGNGNESFMGPGFGAGGY